MAALHACGLAGFWHQTIHEVYVVDFLYKWIFIEQVAVRSVDLDNKRSRFKQNDRVFSGF